MNALSAKSQPSRKAGPVPAEWAEHKCIWTAFPSAADLWQEDLEGAQKEVAAMVRALAENGGDAMKVLVMGEAALKAAKDIIGDVAQIIPGKFGDIWLRDTGPIFTSADTALRFRTNGWGGKYDLEFDDTVGDDIAKAENADIIANDFVLEGGALEHDGQGTIITTSQCLLNPNRNPGWTQDKVEAALKESLGAHKIIWLGDGLAGDHTDGHVDNIARFIAPGKVVCQSPSGNDDPNEKVLKQIAADLRAAGLETFEIPSPGRVEDEDGNPIAASHMNFIIGNKTVVMPTYGTQSAETAIQELQKLFPDRRVIGLPSNAILTGGGSFHCITQQVPK